jgi:sugar phosphate isomerase/epimerase
MQPASPDELFAKLEMTGISRLQLNLDPLRESPEVWGGFAEMAAARGVEIVSGMFGTIGEDYTTLDTIRETGGVVPDATWEANQNHILACADIARAMGLTLVTFHAGFLPHDPADPDTVKLTGRIRKIAGWFADRGIALATETGQESADTLREFLELLDCPNVGVNFDPANMLLYGKGDPIAAMRELGPWIYQVHIKDANATQVPGTWGEEVVVGTGQVDWKAFLATLDELGFSGNACIEREAGTQRVEDIRTAQEFVTSLLARLTPE